LNPRITPVEFLLTICEELGLAIAETDRNSVKEMVDALNRRLLSAHAEGRRIIVLVDEAQNLSFDVLEQVRLLTNLETPTQKLLQIILIGQPELRELLDRTDLRQLAQRITGRYHLKPLSREETKGYVRHRLRVAGATEEIFTPGALVELHRLSLGIHAGNEENQLLAGAPCRRRSLWAAIFPHLAGVGGGFNECSRARRHPVSRLAILAPPESRLERIARH
jgi:general secretion pathway protein A